MNTSKLTLAATLLVGVLSAGLAQARGAVDVQWQVTVATPGIHLPGHVVLPLPPILLPRVVVTQQPPEMVYREPRRWDADGDGIPNHRDPVYNPGWQRDARGERCESRDRHAYRDYRDYRDNRNYRDHRDWQRHDDRRDDRRDWRDDSRHDHTSRHH